MARRGENIRKRSDGRWEGRYIKSRSADGKPCWGYVYGATYILRNVKDVADTGDILHIPFAIFYTTGKGGTAI